MKYVVILTLSLVYCIFATHKIISLEKEIDYYRISSIKSNAEITNLRKLYVNR